MERDGLGILGWVAIACLAGLQSGVFKDLNDMGKSWRADKTYSPNMDADKRTALIEGWTKSVELLNTN